MTIDIESLKRDLKYELQGAFYGAGFGGALIESFQIDNMTDEQIKDLAKRYGITPEDYEIEDDENIHRR